LGKNTALILTHEATDQDLSFHDNVDPVARVSFLKNIPAGLVGSGFSTLLHGFQFRCQQAAEKSAGFECVHGASVAESRVP
jgi:hypothetical protein